jgi:hypothetical protein
MANGENAEKWGHAGRDYWSKRFPSTCLGWGKSGKILTKRFERRKSKQIIKEEIQQLNE